jgi:hypothetical protein
MAGVDNPCEARLRGLSQQQLADRLKWLSWYQPGIFTAVMDYMQFSDALAADTDPTNPDPDPDDVNYGEDPAPVCCRLARRRSWIPTTPPSWPGASLAQLWPGSDQGSREPYGAPSALQRGARHVSISLPLSIHPSVESVSRI